MKDSKDRKEPKTQPSHVGETLGYIQKLMLENENLRMTVLYLKNRIQQLESEADHYSAGRTKSSGQSPDADV